MLGDNAERPMNPLKKAMRRRNAKTVQFSDPTYYEVSDVDYSTDDEADDDDGVDDVGADAEADDVQRHARDDRDEITAVESLRSDDRTAPNTGNEAHERVATGNAADANKEARARSSSDSADTSKDETGDRNGKQRRPPPRGPVHTCPGRARAHATDARQPSRSTNIGMASCATRIPSSRTTTSRRGRSRSRPTCYGTIRVR